MGLRTIYPFDQLQVIAVASKNTFQRSRAPRQPPARALPAFRSASRSQALTAYWSLCLLPLSWREFDGQRRPHRSPLAGSSHSWVQAGSARRVGAIRVECGRGQQRSVVIGAHASLACTMLVVISSEFSYDLVRRGSGPSGEMLTFFFLCRFEEISTS